MPTTKRKTFSYTLEDDPDIDHHVNHHDLDGLSAYIRMVIRFYEKYKGKVDQPGDQGGILPIVIEIRDMLKRGVTLHDDGDQAADQNWDQFDHILDQIEGQEKINGD